MDDNDRETPASVTKARRRARRLPLIAAAIAFTAIGLTGPLMLAAEIDPSPYLWFIASLWLVVIGGLWLWRRSFLDGVARTPRRTDRREVDREG